MGHDWHVLDAERGLEVRCVNGKYEIRRRYSRLGRSVELSVEDWDSYLEDRGAIRDNVLAVLD